MHDLVIRNGTVVDGTGRAAFPADVAVDGDRIVAVGVVPGSAWRTVDADGCLVTPGFIDPHTHLDAQLFWDPLASPCCWHGITTVVVGNCSVTFAPVRAGDEERLARTLESVEQIPAESILAGVPFGWRDYGGYLDALAARPLGVNAAGLVGHAALRQHAMGAASVEEGRAPDPRQLAELCGQLGAALSAGALGVSTSRTASHPTPEGLPIPGSFAPDDELFAMAAVLREQGRGVVQWVAGFGERDQRAGLSGGPGRGAPHGGDQPALRRAARLQHVHPRAGADPASHRARRGGSRTRRRRRHPSHVQPPQRALLRRPVEPLADARGPVEGAVRAARPRAPRRPRGRGGAARALRRSRRGAGAAGGKLAAPVRPRAVRVRAAARAAPRRGGAEPRRAARGDDRRSLPRDARAPDLRVGGLEPAGGRDRGGVLPSRHARGPGGRGRPRDRHLRREHDHPRAGATGLATAGRCPSRKRSGGSPRSRRRFSAFRTAAGSRPALGRTST